MTQTNFKGMTFDDFHRYRIKRAVGFANQRKTNFDYFVKAKDWVDWNWFLDLDEQDKAHAIDYAHGMELDDFGDDFSIPRDGLDDEKYRFLLKSRRLVRDSKGTFPNLLAIASTLLGCSPTDINISNDRHYKNGQLVGEPNTININNIDIEKVANPDFIPLLPRELNPATLASVRIQELAFYEHLSTEVRTPTAMAVGEHITIDLPDYINDGLTVNVENQITTGNTVAEHYSI